MLNTFLVTLLAQDININGQALKGPLVGVTTISDVINIMVKFIVPFAVIILFLVLVWGGYDFLLSQGNPEKVKSGRLKITTGFIGFILILVSYILVKLISTIFGVGEGIL